jgi:hypothetical protein
MKNNNDIGSNIDRIGKKRPFSVPEGYFDSFPEKVRGRLQNEEVSAVSVPERVWQVLRPQLSLAAVIIGFAIIGYIGFNTLIQSEKQLLSDEVITEYVDYYQHEFSDYYLVSMLDFDEFELEDGGYYDDDADAYMDYLYMDNIEIELIISDF